MKYIVILGDGMAGEPLDALQGRTTLDAAATPHMDALAAKGEVGLTKMVPEDMKPGSDVANLGVLGYDPKKYYSGRSPLEALSVGVAMEETDVVLRCNLVTLSEEEPYEKKRILDHSAGEISTEEADALMDAVRSAFNSDVFSFHTGTSYRHITLWKGGRVLDFAQPHDHLGQVITPYLPQEPVFLQMMKKSFEILNNHPVNQKRAAAGKNKANSLWFWGAGTKPSLRNFKEKTGKSGAMISAVDLLKGIAVGAGMTVVEVPGASGSLHTNYEGKAAAAVAALQNHDFVYIHVEAPDEMGHQGSIENKIQAIENLDRRVVAKVVQALQGKDYRLLILPDHPTPIAIRTHTGKSVPYILYDSRFDKNTGIRYTEKEAATTGISIDAGYTLMDYFLSE